VTLQNRHEQSLTVEQLLALPGTRTRIHQHWPQAVLPDTTKRNRKPIYFRLAVSWAANTRVRRKRRLRFSMNDGRRAWGFFGIRFFDPESKSCPQRKFRVSNPEADLDHGLQAAYTGKGFTSIHAELHFSDPLSK
jgi:hypothetical protein